MENWKKKFFFPYIKHYSEKVISFINELLKLKVYLLLINNSQIEV